MAVPRQMGWLRIVAAIAVVVVVANIALSFAHRALVRQVSAQHSDELMRECARIAALVDAQPGSGAARLPPRALLPSDHRLTLIAADGRVLFESSTEAVALGSHADRDEVKQALATGTGMERRFSTTAGRDLVYAARRLADGTVLRVAAPVADEDARAVALWTPTFLACLTIAAAGIGVTALFLWQTRRRLGRLIAVAAELRAGRYDARAGHVGSDHVARLGAELDRLGEALLGGREELARSRALLDTALGALRDGVACIDAMDRVVYANRAWDALVAGGGTAVGRAWYELLPAPELTGRLEAVRGGAEGGHEVEFTHRDRRLCAALAPAGAVVVVTISDLTELRRLEHARRDFVAGVSHELKTPLTSILGYADTLLDGVLAEDPRQARDFVVRISRHAERLASLVHDVLSLSRLEQGAWEVHPDEVDLPALMRAVVDEHAEHARERSVRVSLTAPEQLLVLTDPELVRQLIGNLVSNAIRYNRPEGSVRIALEHDAADVRIIVADTGIGIPQQHQERIFERFYRIDAHRSRQTGGTGLGLAIVKQILAVLGGTITLRSDSTGSAFAVTLPVAPQR